VNVIPFVVLIVLVLALFWVTQRKRQQAAAAAESRRRATIGFGSPVMTTSGLYGTVTRLDDDDTVQLAIAPGVEVKWALAALRDVESLPDRYKQGVESARTDEPPEDGPRP
jgi:preprotein translocase subunit YajC